MRIAAKAGFALVKWSISRISQTLGLTLEPTFEDSDSGVHLLDRKLYGLEHMALNWTWEGGLKTMWMNMGYWKDTDSMPQAAENLLKYLLKKAGIIDPPGKVTRDRSISILDLGFGCGDQTLYLTSQLPQNIDVTSYVGITLSKVQYSFAKKRVLDRLEPMPPNSDQRRKGNISLYNADASNPAAWPSSLHLSWLPSLSPSTSPQPPSQKPLPAVPHEHWTLGLDSLYHFRPSRVPILKYTHDNLQSNLLAFDLLRPSSGTSVTQSLFLRAVCIAASIPYHNLLTKEEYIHMLVTKVGYHEEEIIIEDISDFVFSGLAGFISRRTKEMEKIGMKWKRWAGFKVFVWVLQTGLLRGGVVLARWREAETGRGV
ncbi:hypothetical protein L211DRAFT_783808 [Terfezia boudieri ATCC MYA-4762]|uniref:S-adenosyl-L-methionine-dependent methyltransferase n=1 Tax=Terfezia boudieri ATCC MYA-4762 TaxID=1051890 RepID=A0A3N4LPY8_9PEZI|nr:hypothetical protein L211DRAFT_783808 [Terfezia boudieri ATCC MYA-4762]